MAGRASDGGRGTPPKAASDQLRELHSKIEELADAGLTVTEPAREPAPVTAGPPGRRRHLGRTGPGLRAAALAELSGSPGDALVVPQGPAAAVPGEATLTPEASTAAAGPPVRRRKPDPVAAAEPGAARKRRSRATAATKPAPIEVAARAGTAVPTGDAPPPEVLSPLDEDARLFAPTRPRRLQPVDIEDDIDPRNRPWSVEAALQPLPPLSPAEMPARDPQPEPPHHSRVMTAVVLVAVATLIFVVIASRLDLGRTTAPSFAINELVALKDGADTSVTPTGHFLTTAPRIDLQATYVGATQGDKLTLQVSFAGSEFAAHTYDLTPGTSTAGGPLTPTGVDFKPGVYEIAAIWHGTRLRATNFTIDQPQPAPGSTPTATDTPAPSATASP